MSRDGGHAPGARRLGWRCAAVLLLCGACVAAPDTRVSEQAFRLLLPGAWSARRDATAPLWVFRSADHPEQLTVTLLRAAEPLAPDEMATTLDELCKRRREVEVMAASSPVLMTEVERGTRGDALVARYEGVETTGSRWSTTMVVVTPELAAVIYFEHLGKRDESAAARAQRALDSVVVSPDRPGVVAP